MSTSSLYALCVLIWGTTWYAITVQIAVVAPEVGVALRFCLASAVLLAACRWRGVALGYPRRLHALFAAQGLTGLCASYICVYHAERFVASGVVAVGYAASPLVGLAMARVFLGTPMSGRVALGGMAGLAGVALIFGQEFDRLGEPAQVAAGAALTAAAVALSSVSTIVAARYHREGVGGWAPLGYAMGYGGLGAVAASVALGRAWSASWSPAFTGSLLYLALVGSVVTFGAYYTLVHRIGPARAGYVGVVSPVVALAVSAVFEGVAWTPAIVGGIALAIAGNVVAMWPRGRPPSPQDSSTNTGA